MEQSTQTGTPLAALLRAARDQFQATGRGDNLSTIAKKAGINRAIVTDIANGKRIARHDQEKQIRDAMWVLDLIDKDGLLVDEHADAPESEHPVPVVAQTEMPQAAQVKLYKHEIELYETQQFKDAMSWCELMRRLRKTGIMIGHPGSGKTTVLKEFRDRVPGVHYIECYDTMHMGDMLGEIARAIGISVSGNLYQRTKQVERELLQQGNVMLIFDEAEQLHKWNFSKLETLRKLGENSETPVILAGTLELKNLLIRANMAQLYRRQYGFDLRGIEPKEVRSILRDYNLSVQAATELERIALDVRHGGMGNFVEILGLCLTAADGERIDGEIMNTAKKYKLLY